MGKIIDKDSRRKNSDSQLQSPGAGTADGDDTVGLLHNRLGANLLHRIIMTAGREEEGRGESDECTSDVW